MLIMFIMLIFAYLLGTTQAETITEIKVITETIEIIPDECIDMREVTDYTATVDGLQLYFEDGSGYYLER